MPTVFRRTVAVVALMSACVCQGFVVTPSPQSPVSSSTALASQSNDDGIISSRRQVLNSAFLAALTLTPAVAANALDMDSFANSQIEADTKNCDPKRDPKCIPKLSADEALCKYGQSGTARGEACRRVKAAGGTVDKAPQGKSLGGAYAM
ncbi:expressed unknown protein [Seminavis robusta]|uniref:Uncharacterized protein n=1 Tax=Seminavis robusta TaxID=568900 RepID=A0A9N8D9C6_9STRA|nr:expressed unknown protein [Seminavis robusta]|eukprot:Sro40_g024480.1 n/a (150) ;mRNA; r:11399-11987